MVKNIKITDFAKRHFDPKFGGTKITTGTIESFEDLVNTYLRTGSDIMAKVMDGYAPFCKLIAIENPTDAKVGTMPIDMANYQYLRSGYSSRTPNELPVFSRWFELPLPAPKANYLILVVYSKEQIDKEGRETEGEHNDPNEKYVPLDADWGIVAILGQTHNSEEPMSPITMMRNALGTKEGGSGVTLNKEKYLESVEFWKHNAIVKS